MVPVKAEPVYVFLYSLDIFNILFGGVGVVKTQVALAAVLFRGAEIYAYGFSVTDMKIAVGLGRKTGLHPVINTFAQVFVYKIFYEIRRGFGRFFKKIIHCYISSG